jgi:tetratricopeptide (TPR) repeat protein
MKFKKSSACGAGAWLFVVLAVLGAGCGDSRKERGQKFIARGIAALNEGNSERALYYFEQARQIDSCFASALNNMGTVHFKEQRYAEALRYYDGAIECDPNFLDGYFNRANTLFSTRNYEGALSDLDFVIRQKPDTALAHFTRGLALTRMGRHEEAMESFTRAGNLDTSFLVDSRVNSAAVLVLMRRYPEAEAALRAHLVINPREPNIYNSLALVKAEQGRYDSALFLVNKALSMSAGEPYFLNNRGYIYLLMDDLQAAAVDIDKSIALDPYNGWAYRNKGILCLKEGHAQQAVRLMTRSLEMDPYIDHVHYYLGKAHKMLGNDAEACSYFRKGEQAGDPLVTEELMRPCRRAL